MKHKLILFLFVLAASTACVHDDSEESETDARRQASVYVSYEQPRTAPGIVLQGAEGTEGTEGVSDTAPIIIKDFKAGDLLYFSQLTNTSAPNFTVLDDLSHPLYIYQYKQKDASWEKGFNFESTDDNNIFDWGTAEKNGSVGNAFSFFAFYYPENPTIESKGPDTFRVKDDQRGGEADRYDQSNFKKSDIMGAYHATSSLYTRMRFRLFHLMVYLKVTLYVPVYEDSGKESEKTYSGFKEGALQDAFVMNAQTDFTIEWQANRSSDTEAPLTQAVGDKRSIVMYRHPSDEEEIKIIDVKDYYTQDDIGQDRVRAYTFSVLFPAQTFSNDFLCFPILAPNNETMKYYYFASSQILGGADENKFGLSQGTLQELSLYLPRMTNETVLVDAKILPWHNAATDMTVTQGTTQDTAEGGESQNGENF